MKTRKHRYVRIPLDEGKHRFVLHLRADWISGARRAAPGHHLRGPGRRQDGRELRRHEPRYLAGRKVRRGGAWVRLAGDRCRDRTSAARPGFGDRTAFLSLSRETGDLLQRSEERRVG